MAFLSGQRGHFLKLCFNERVDKYIGISWPFVTGGDKKLWFINKDKGSIEMEISIGSPVETEFALGGQLLVTSDREIINLETGERKTWT